LFFFRHVVRESLREGLFDLVDAFLVVGHFESASIYLGLVRLLGDVVVNKADLGTDATYIVSDAVAKGFACSALNFIFVFEWDFTAAVSVLVVVRIAIASSAKSIDMVWGNSSGDGVLVNLKGVDQVDLGAF
jgi:hypothetical protein